MGERFQFMEAFITDLFMKCVYNQGSSSSFSCFGGGGDGCGKDCNSS